MSGGRFIGWHIVFALKSEEHNVAVFHRGSTPLQELSCIEEIMGNRPNPPQLSAEQLEHYRQEDVTEQFILRLESALRQELGSLSLFRLRNNVLFVRFTLRRTYDEDSAEADRIEESPSLYLGSGQSSGFTAREMVVA